MVFYIKLIQIRNTYPCIGRGEYKSLNISGTNIGGFEISYEGKTYYLIHNTLQQEGQIDFSSIGLSATYILAFIGQGECTFNNGILNIGPQTSVLLIK